jgi:nucleotide-binding universal stress UspA family protein
MNDGPSSIVVGVDGTPRSERAPAWAIGTSRRMHAKLIALHATTDLALNAFDPAMGCLTVQSQCELNVQLEHDLDAQLDGTGIEWTFRSEAGDPVATIERVAGEERADLVVVGSPSRWHLHSVATRLVRRARHPIVVIP